MRIFHLLLIFFFVGAQLSALDTQEGNLTQEQIVQQEELERLAERQRAEELREQNRLRKIAAYESELQELEKEISKDNIWLKSYASYITSLEVRTNLAKIKKRIEELEKSAKTISDRDELNALRAKESILTSQVEKLKGRSVAPFSDLITPPTIEKAEEIGNPFDIFTGISIIKKLNANFDEYKLKRDTLIDLIVLLRKESNIYKALEELDSSGKYSKIKRGLPYLLLKR